HGGLALEELHGLPVRHGRQAQRLHCHGLFVLEPCCQPGGALVATAERVLEAIARGEDCRSSTHTQVVILSSVTFSPNWFIRTVSRWRSSALRGPSTSSVISSISPSAARNASMR